MVVKVVTDSTADLPLDLAQALDICVVPLSINFGTSTYVDGVDLEADEFYAKLRGSATLPTTSQPSPEAFAKVYEKLGATAEGIVSIHISAKLSGTYNSASLGRSTTKTSCYIELIDSCHASMGLGLITLQAARAAQAGAPLDEVVRVTGEAITQTRFFGVVDTLEYLHKGGRIGKAQVLLGTLLSIKPVLHVKDGEIHPWGKERTRRKALNRVFEIAQSCENIREIAILHSTTPDEAAALIAQLCTIVDKERIIQSRIGPVIGTYLGPGAVSIGIIEDTANVSPAFL